MAQARRGHTGCSGGTDGLTGLLDRRGWEDTAMAVFRHARRHGEDLSLLLVGLDGCTVGDDLLRSVAAVLRAMTSRVDLPGRYGGDEFVVLLPDTGYGRACQVADQIKVAIRVLAMTTEASSVSASIGVASCRQADDIVLADLVGLAEEGLRLARYGLVEFIP